MIATVPLGGLTWAVEANDKRVTNVRAGALTPQPGEVYEVVQNKKFWLFDKPVRVTTVPAELRHPKYVELCALADSLTGPEVLRIGSRIVVPAETDPATLVELWRFSSLDGEADYCAALVRGRQPYPDVKIQLRPETSNRLRSLIGLTTEALDAAADRYEQAIESWADVVITARAEWQEVVVEAEKPLNSLTQTIQGLKEQVSDLTSKRDELIRGIKGHTRRRQTLSADLTRLETQVQAARERLRDQEQADQDPRSILRRRTSLSAEAEALRFAADRLGNRFNSPVPLVRLHVALKHAPFTVLTGPSGAGKTSLVHQYARALGIHVTTVAVQPNWTSVQDLHGYVDPLGGRHYRGTPFSVALQAQSNYEAVADHEAPLDLVLLDEINLAFVEYFLSDYLSAFETADRRVQLATRDEAASLPEETFGWLRRGHGQVRVPRSFLIAGTANEDHTTRAFSDKFRDRSAFLHLTPPTIQQALQTPERPVDSDAYVTRAAWESWQTGHVADDTQRAAIRQLAEKVATMGLPFSVRVFQRALRQYADAQRLLTELGMKDAAAHAYDLAVSLSVAPKYAPLLLGREKNDARLTLQQALTREGTGQLTREVLEGIWPIPRG